MNYILKKFEEHISLLVDEEDKSGMDTFCQSRFEFVLTYLLAYLWNKNINKLKPFDKEALVLKLQNPSIGTIVESIRVLDLGNDIPKQIQTKHLDKYPDLRNKCLGHGFTYDKSDYIEQLNSLYESIVSSSIGILKNDVDIILVKSYKDGVYKGRNYKYNTQILSWSCPETIYSFEVGELYIMTDVNKYFKISPFIVIADYDKIYIFNSVVEKLLGKIKYNRLFENGVINRECNTIKDMILETDDVKRKTGNGTIINNFQNNYHTFIDVQPLKKSIIKFLSSNKASVCATIWGHGGVGKTATIQSICEDLANDSKKVFDYIIFLSAKDRRYNYLSGEIESIDGAETSCDALIKTINSVVFGEESVDPNNIIGFEGKVLIVIDDFETFSKEESNKIIDLINQFNINHHKVVITTRAAKLRLGEEFQSNELSEKETVDFLKQVIANERLSTVDDKKLSISGEVIHQVTSGRPLFIFQLAYIISQKGIDDALSFDIKSSSSAISFLYGRLYDYLSSNAKGLFCVLSLLTDSSHLGNLIDKAKYILGMDNSDEEFDNVVNELLKLKIIKFTDDENRFFEIYSSEIFQMMAEHYQKLSDAFKGKYKRRLSQVNQDKDLDLENSLLLAANQNRISKKEIEVVDSYKQILNRTNNTLDIKLKALLNLAEYLFKDCNKRGEALSVLEDYSHLFIIHNKDDNRCVYANFVKMWAVYNWSNGNSTEKNKAKEILLEYSEHGFDYSSNIDLELVGMLLQYSSIIIVQDWQSIKSDYKEFKISLADANNAKSQLRQDAKNIHDKIGMKFYTEISSTKLDGFSSGARQNIISGMYSYTDLLIRIQKFDLAIEICDYVLLYAPANFHRQFDSRRNFAIRCKLDQNFRG